MRSTGRPCWTSSPISHRSIRCRTHSFPTGFSAKTVATPSREQLLDVYERLYAAYGPQCWWPSETPFEVIVGAILVQSAAWGNVEKAIGNLKSAGALSPEGLRAIPQTG